MTRSDPLSTAQWPDLSEVFEKARPEQIQRLLRDIRRGETSRKGEPV